MRKIERISTTAADRERLERLVRDRNTPQRVVWRARIVLRWTDGGGDCCGGRQEPADRPPLAPSLCGERRGRAAEGRDPTVACQAAAVRQDQAGGAHDAARETDERDPLEGA